MRIVMRVKGRLYDDNITGMIVVQRLKSLITDGEVVLRDGLVHMTLAVDMVGDSDGVIGIKEAIAADFEPIAKIEFIEITA